MPANQLPTGGPHGARVVQLARRIALDEAAGDDVDAQLLGQSRQLLTGGSVGHTLGILGKVLDAVWRIETLRQYGQLQLGISRLQLPDAVQCVAHILHHIAAHRQLQDAQRKLCKVEDGEEDQGSIGF